MARTTDWDQALLGLTGSTEAADIVGGRHRDECWEIAIEYLAELTFLDSGTGEHVGLDDLEDDYGAQITMFTATGIWLGLIAADSPDFIKHGGHRIAHRIRRLRRRLAR